MLSTMSLYGSYFYEAYFIVNLLAMSLSTCWRVTGLRLRPTTSKRARALSPQVKVWFQNRRMKWRHSKEAQAQKDKEKETPDKSLTEAESKEPEESECESEASESDFEDGQEDKSDMDISEHNKTSVIMTGATPVSTEEATSVGALTETVASSQM